MFNKVYFYMLLLILGGISYPQPWLPLDTNNTWQYLKSYSTGAFPNYTVTYSLEKIYIDRDTVINENRFFFWLTKCIRYSDEDRKAYEWKGDHEEVYMDFTKAIGDTFYAGNIVYTITGGNTTLFDTILPYKGFKNNAYSPPGVSSWKSVKFAPQIGWYYFNNGMGNIYNTSDYTSNLLMAILYDSLGAVYQLTNNYKPQINFIPISTTNTRLLRTPLDVNHAFNIGPSASSSGFPFVDTIFMEGFYSKEDSIFTVPTKYSLGNPNGNYNFNTILDTSYMKNGYIFNYRFIAIDKGIIPETSYSPDTGYYKCTWDFSTAVNDVIELQLKEFSLFQNYPNPFNPSTKISWQSPVGSHQTLKVYDVLGREVATLVDEYRDAGSYEVEYDGTQLASGVYYYQLKVGEYVITKKLMLLK